MKRNARKCLHKGNLWKLILLINICHIEMPKMPWCWVAPGHSGWVVRRGESQAAHHSQGCPLGDSVTGWLKLRGVFQCATAEVLDPSGETSKCDACDGKGVVIQAGMCVRMYWCFFILAAFLSGFLKAYSATFCTEPCSSSSHLLSWAEVLRMGPIVRQAMV